MRLRKYLKEKKKEFKIEIELRNAKKANDIITDNPNIKFEQTSSNSYKFKDEEHFNHIIDLLEKYKIEYEII